MKLGLALLLVVFLLQLAQESLGIAALGAVVALSVLAIRKVHQQYERFPHQENR